MAAPTNFSFEAATPDKHATSAPSHHDLAVTPQSLPPLADVDANGNASMSAPDSEKHPKGKRKRTAAKDKMILEEAYSSNPKPDKQARLDIVQRVSLNEKEVQIWFQNRRQNDRRKSRPLSQQEYAALQFGNMHVITSDPIANTTTPSKPEKAFPVTDPNVSRFADHISAPPRRFDQTPSMPRSHSDHVNSTPVSMNHDRSYRFYPDVTPNRIDPSLSHEAHGHSHSLSGSMSSNVGYLANRWNPGAGSFSTPPAMSRSGDDSFRYDHFPPSSCTSERSSFTHSQSKVRLSMSLDGKAELVSNQGSPSREMPPRPSSTTPSLPQVRQRNLQRSQSTIPAVTLPPITALTNTLPPRLMRGRSRDVHAWESCADAENRDELTAQAENESNGSAIAAINLLRSSSGVQPPSTAKRNASMMKPQRPQQAKKARLDPSGSSFSRLETELDETEKADREYGKVKVSMLVSPTGGDSDKENLTPDEDASSPDPYHRRPLPPASKPVSENPRRVGRVLQEQKSPNLFANRANTAPSRPRSIIKEGLEIFEDRMKSAMPSRENEVEKFMRGSISPSKKPDMDCVAGLLSLSQGAWR
ncbi:related to LIM homeobox protein [Fusarium torulosum]|uniref:Related to LIM homeobox protein n=1 Tax=Fusarium torulosum TaxID=33205 RepID=A0AAE8SIE6_9HYPO|nr:related to LIM homeobox protein [Fusarium torulosum]